MKATLITRNKLALDYLFLDSRNSLTTIWLPFIGTLYVVRYIVVEEMSPFLKWKKHNFTNIEQMFNNYNRLSSRPDMDINAFAEFIYQINL